MESPSLRGTVVGHPEIDNATPFAASLTFGLDESGRPLLVVLVEATYALAAGRSPTLAEEQPPTSLTGELWGEDSSTSSYRIEPAFAFMKPATDVALVGHAHALRGPVTELEVLFRIGSIGRLVRVVGDRFWVRAMGTIGATSPVAFAQMPLGYERAFGGWDRSHADPTHHTFEPRNPIGMGFRAPDGVFEERVPLPNIEDPRDLIRQYGQRAAPAGLGFVSPHWSPRAELAGTFDAAWAKERHPLSPLDFDRRFFNAGSKGLVAAGYLRGDEEVVIENASMLGRLVFRLPNVRPPACRVSLRGLPDREVAMAMDTVVADTDRGVLRLTFRGFTELRGGAHDVRAIHLKPADT